MIERFSKLTPVTGMATAIALLLSPSVGLANTLAKSKAHQTQVVRQPVRQAVQFQGKASARSSKRVRSLEQVIKDQRDWYQMID
jgi:hypothetical protein